MQHEALFEWRDFNLALVTAAAALLGLLFVALSLHLRPMADPRNAELRAVARSIFLGYVVSMGIGFFALMPQSLRAFGIEMFVLVLVSTIPFSAAARAGLRERGVGYNRALTVAQFIAGFALFAVAIGVAIAAMLEVAGALYLMGSIGVLSLLWGVFNTWDLLFRMHIVAGRDG